MNLRDERGVTLIELLIVMVLTAIIMVAIVNVFVSGSRAGANANAELASQQTTRLALDRIEHEGRCASTAGLVSSGAGVTFTLPSECEHGTGTISWCVVGGVLEKLTTAGCGGTGQTFVTGITTATPFTLISNTGDLPQLLIAISSGSGGSAATLDDTITLRNATVS